MSGMLDKDKLEEVNVEFLKPGTVLTGVVFDDKGTVLWPARKPMTDFFISKLRVKGIRRVFYIPPKTSGPVDKYKGPGLQPDIFSAASHEAASAALEEIVHQINFNKIPDVNLVKKTIENYFKEMESSPNGFLNLMVLKDYDTYTYTHSINVGLLAMYLTRKLGYNNYYIHEMGVGGFLHDIGKVKIPSRIVNKHGNLSEEEFRIMKNHPIYGYNLVKDDATLSNYVKKVVLFHHERWDGTGYPLKLAAEAIGNFANMVSVCDVYDALSTERSYKKPYTVSEALQYIMKNTVNAFSPYIAQRFINEMAQMYDVGSYYSVGSFVLLNTNETAYITGKDQEYSLKPEIAIIKNAKGVPLRTPLHVDLKRDVSRTIQKVLEEPEEIEQLAMLMA
jgi:HD-GYP domain-containing protein (c-di-GMP phosphodiesterase class II)